MDMSELAAIVMICDELIKMAGNEQSYDDHIAISMAVKVRAKALKLMREE